MNTGTHDRGYGGLLPSERVSLSGQVLSGTVQGTAVQAGTITGGVHVHTTSRTAAVIPRQLPTAMPGRYWVDRKAEFTNLDTTLANLGTEPAVVVLSGEGGIGKTALATRWIRQRCTDSTHPGGQLYADLAKGPAPADLVAGWLRAWGCAVVPDSAAERHTLFRSLAARQPFATLLDNAVCEQQVLELLAHSPGSITLVTSHIPLPLTRIGAEHLTLGSLDDDSTTTLLHSLTGGEGTVACDVVRALATGCQGSPLAATVLAGRLRHRTALPPLPLPIGLTEITTMTYASLSVPAQRLYRRLGQHPSAEVDACLAAPLLDAGPDEAGRVLDELATAALVTVTTGQDGTRRCRMADPVAEHARSLMHGDSPQEQAAVQDRVYDWYRHMLLAVATTLNSFTPRYQDEPATDSAVGDPAFPDSQAAMEWFDHELAALRGMLQQAQATGADEWLWQAVEAAWVPAMKGAYANFLIEAHELAAVAADQCGRLDVQATMLARLSWGHRQAGELDQASAAAERAGTVAIAAGDRWAESAALSAAGRARFALGDFPAAERLYLRSRELADGRARSLGLRDRHLGDCATAQGQPQRARDYYAASAEQLAAIADREGSARSAGKLAAIDCELGHPERARTILTEPLQVMATAEPRTYLADLLVTLAVAEDALGESSQAQQHRTEAAELYRLAGRPDKVAALRGASLEFGTTAESSSKSQV